MNDYTGAAGVAAEPVNPSQDAGGAVAQPDAGARQPEPAIDRSQETARASVERAFAELDDQGEGTGQGRTDGRDEWGRFKARGDGEGQTEGPDKADHQLDKPVTAIQAPARFSGDAKAAWATVPDAVKGEVERTVKELETGLTQYQQVFEPLKHFFAMARHANTTVHDALHGYTTVEQALRGRDADRKLLAIEGVLETAGLTPAEYAAIIARQPVPQRDATIDALKAEIADLRTQMGGFTHSMHERQLGDIERAVNAFAADHPRIDENGFAQKVTRLIETGMANNLHDAYDMAERLNPAPARYPQPNPGSNPGHSKPATAHTRNGNLSVTGAPGSGSNPAKRKAPATARESVDSAFASLGIG